MYFFYNGDFLESDTTAISLSDRGLLYGDGLFTTFKAIDAVLLHFPQHIQRLKKTASFLGIPWVYSESQLYEYCQQLLQVNQLTDHKTAVLRITLSRGAVAERNSQMNQGKPMLMITAAAYYEPTDYYPRLCITSVRRNDFSALVQHKTLNYLEPILARQEARQRGFDDGIFLNTQGVLTEAAVANLFFVHNGVVITPPVEDGLLPGIMRAMVITLCQQHGIPMQQISVHPSQIQHMQEAFLTNSLIGIQSIACIDEHLLSHGAAALFTQNIKTAYLLQQGKRAKNK